jgi:uncharacterized protein
MLLFRIILLLAIIFIAWRIYRLVVTPRVPPHEKKQRLRGEDMVECAFCAVHVPRASAIAAEDRWYCCEEHRQRHAAGESKG